MATDGEDARNCPHSYCENGSEVVPDGLVSCDCTDTGYMGLRCSEGK